MKFIIVKRAGCLRHTVPLTAEQVADTLMQDGVELREEILHWASISKGESLRIIGKTSSYFVMPIKAMGET